MNKELSPLEVLKEIEKEYNQLGIHFGESGWHINESLYFIIENELKEKEQQDRALEIIKSAGFSLEFDESQNEWFLHITAKGTGVKTYDLLKEVLL